MIHSKRLLYEISREDCLFVITQYEPNRKAARLSVSTIGWVDQYSKNQKIEKIIALQIDMIKQKIRDVDETNSGSIKGLKWILKTLQEKLK